MYDDTLNDDLEQAPLYCICCGTRIDWSDE